MRTLISIKWLTVCLADNKSIASSAHTNQQSAKSLPACLTNLSVREREQKRLHLANTHTWQLTRKSAITHEKPLRMALYGTFCASTLVLRSETQCFYSFFHQKTVRHSVCLIIDCIITANKSRLASAAEARAEPIFFFCTCFSTLWTELESIEKEKKERKKRLLKLLKDRFDQQRRQQQQQLSPNFWFLKQTAAFAHFATKSIIPFCL